MDSFQLITSEAFCPEWRERQSEEVQFMGAETCDAGSSHPGGPGRKEQGRKQRHLRHFTARL